MRPEVVGETGLWLWMRSATTSAMISCADPSLRDGRPAVTPWLDLLQQGHDRADGVETSLGARRRRKPLNPLFLLFFAFNPEFPAEDAVMTQPGPNPQEQFIALMTRHQPDLRAFLSSVVWDRHRVEDLLQEAALVLWRKFDTYEASRPFGAWARGIAANLVKQSLDRSRAGEAALSAPALKAVVRAYDEGKEFDSDRQEALRACLERLPEHSRRLLTLRYENSLSLDAISRRLEKRLEAVHMMLSRIRAKLFDCVRQRLATSGR